MDDGLSLAMAEAEAMMLAMMTAKAEAITAERQPSRSLPSTPRSLLCPPRPRHGAGRRTQVPKRGEERAGRALRGAPPAYSTPAAAGIAP
eukprot:12469836-Alexandrium_andersonii.AAC.1